MEWNITVKERLYHKLAEELLLSILAGVFPPGRKLPSNTVLLEKANTSQETLRKALHTLSDQKVIEKTRCAYFVTENISIIHTIRQQYIEHKTEEYRKVLSKINCKATI